ncbi:hypothetical protein C8J45_103344 [Sphingomonas sp. PP-CE-3G-477]|uniref:hypothetical protein n=1 Tax=Sphingomonas sp. PP-CE-3G-477 TaxID=2135660 RepID=UPI000D36D79F|nr:hypothetical protein [Sphingomonas sp. PP-CE-3G-477]PTQ64494.1 hypothetical protein C8J45_103344 [Sphingomonas sp. PP-CE-3G-477]
MIPANVLPRRSRPTTKSYRTAVKTIITGIQGHHGLNDPELAERLGCSAGTIKNARNEAGNLDGVTLMNVEYEFGPSALDPVLALGGSRSVPLNVAADDTVSATIELSEVLHLLIAAQSPASEGGVAVTPTELTRILPQLRDARQALDVLIDRARFAA